MKVRVLLFPFLLYLLLLSALKFFCANFSGLIYPVFAQAESSFIQAGHSEQSQANQYERPIVLLITSYNNAPWYERNLGSAFNQNYGNFRIIYVDAASADNTGQLVEEYVRSNGWTDRVTLVKNSTRKFKLENFYWAVHNLCKDEEIVIDYDGDDFWADANALKKINEAYEDSNIWVTYGSYIEWPLKKRGGCRKLPADIIRKNAYRRHYWVTSHPKSFYAWLFKRIKVEDLQHNGRFLSRATDMAMMIPVLEMAGGDRIKYIRDILYLYNTVARVKIPGVEYPKPPERALSDTKCCEPYVRSLSPYKKIESSNFIDNVSINNI